MGGYVSHTQNKTACKKGKGRTSCQKTEFLQFLNHFYIIKTHFFAKFCFKMLIWNALYCLKVISIYWCVYHVKPISITCKIFNVKNQSFFKMSNFALYSAYSIKKTWLFQSNNNHPNKGRIENKNKMIVHKILWTNMIMVGSKQDWQ